MKRITQIFILILLVVSVEQSYSQEYTFNDFVGTWHGTISSTSFGGYNDPITMTIESNGFYTETSGHLMPSLYPNTQLCEYEVSTNRVHWWYLGTVWGGQYFYDHIYYEVVYFENDTLEMHYNYWDDPEPYPEVGTIFLVKESLTPPPTSLQWEVLNNNVSLTWNVPVYGNGGIANPTAYNVYYKTGEGAFVFLVTSSTNEYTHENVTVAGMHSYYVTAMYIGEESNPSNVVDFVLTTPAPTNLQGQLLANNVSLNWDQPADDEQPMAGLLGYNVYHKQEAGEYELLMFVETNYFAHQDIPNGIHYYYVTAVYDGAESVASNEVMVDLVISNVEDQLSITTSVYPNPASDNVHIQSEVEMKSVKIYNQTGQVIKVQQVNSKSQRFDVNDVPAGLYVFVIETEQGTISKRIFVQ